MTDPSLAQHEDEIKENWDSWCAKPLLRRIYREFHEQIARETAPSTLGLTVELGSGIGNIRDVLPHCVRTDLFQSPAIDQIENAYALSFADCSVANIILFDVFHHLECPGAALREFARVLAPGGRVVVFDPCVSVMGLLVYGFLHPEPLGLTQPISWSVPDDWRPHNHRYYAAQGNAFRFFWGSGRRALPAGWSIVRKTRLAALSYVASGGYSGPQLYPASWYPALRLIDRIADALPSLFATRLLVTLEYQSEPASISASRDK